MLSVRSWWLVSAPADLRCRMDRLLLQVQDVLGRAPAEGEAYVFGNRSGTRIKLLCCDRHGVWLAVRRLQQGRFVRPRAGVDWQRLSIAPMSHALSLQGSWTQCFGEEAAKRYTIDRIQDHAPASSRGVSSRLRRSLTIRPLSIRTRRSAKRIVSERCVIRIRVIFSCASAS